MIDRYTVNTAGRDLIVGDIHGKFDLLEAQLKAVRFDPAVDRLFSVGDLVDRGPQSDTALIWLTLPWFKAVQGNHEQMTILHAAEGADGMLAHHHVSNGGAWFAKHTHERKMEIARVFAELPWVIELETPDGLVGIVHATCDYSTWGEFVAKIEAGNEPAISNAIWGRSRFTGARRCPQVDGVRAVVVGHNMTRHILRLENVIHIDTAAVTGAFTLLNAETLQPEPRRP